jgi:hypothetical protein
VAPGLWRESWRSTLTAAAWPDDVRENGGRFVFSLEFPEESEPIVVARPDGHTRGKLPLASDVIEPRPERRVSGHLIVRRSKGIVFPAQLHFGALPVGTNSRTRRLVLTAADQTPFVVTVENPPAAFHVEVDSDEPAVQQWITVTCTPREAGEIENELTLRTTHPLQEQVRIKLKAKVQ